MADQNFPDIPGGQIDLNQVVDAVSSLVPQQQPPAALPPEGDPDPSLSDDGANNDALIVTADASQTDNPQTTEKPDLAPLEVNGGQGASDQKVANRIIVFEGQRFSVPADVSEEEINQIITKYEKSPEYAANRGQTDPTWARENIDTESGAPAFVSSVVGPQGDLSDADRLATLRNYYPDATYYGKDNFIFTDPDSGKRTLYNVPGLDLRDVAEYGKVASEAAFGGLGAAAGFVSGVFTGPGAVVAAPAGAVIGAGIGTEVGARLFDKTMGLFAGRVRTPKPLAEEFVETGVRVGLASAGEAAGPLIASAGKRVLTGGRQAAADLVAKFQSLGIEPVAEAIGRKGMIGRMGAGLEQMATAGPTMQRQAERVIVQLDDALEGIARRMGQIRTPNEAGAALKASVNAAETRIRDGFSMKYTQIFDEIGENLPVDELPSVDSVLQPFLKQIAELPVDARPTGQLMGLIKKWDALSKFSEAGNLTFSQLRDLRTQLRLVRSKKISGTMGDFDNLVDDLYGAVTDDLATAANSVRPDLGGKLKAIDTERAIFADTAQKTFDKIRSLDADNTAWEYLLTSAKGTGKEGVKALQRLRDNFTKEEWGDVAASALYNLGRENAGAQVGDAAEFSVATFMKRLSEIKKNGPEAMDALFGGTQFADVSADLMNLVDVVGALKEAKRFKNFSNTAGALNQMMFWQALSGAGAGLAAGDVLGATAGIVGTVMAPAGAAKLMTSPGFVKWLSTPASEITKDISAHMGRLVAISAAEPEIQEELRQYYKAVRSYTGYTAPQSEGIDDNG